MRSLWLHLPLLLAPLAAPVILTSPAEAAVGPSCCVTEGEFHPGEPPHPKNPLPYFVGARVVSPDERALEAAAEAPVAADVPPVNAIGVSLDAKRGVSEPDLVPLGSESFSEPDQPFDYLSGGCCRIIAITHPPETHGHPRNEEETRRPPVVTVKVRNPDERTLQAAAEAQIEAARQLVNAIGIPLDAKRGVSEPEHPVPVATGTRPAIDWPQIMLATLIASMLVIGFWLRQRRRRVQMELEPLPVTRPLPDQMPRPDAALVPQPEPEVMRAKTRKAEQELEPA